MSMVRVWSAAAVMLVGTGGAWGEPPAPIPGAEQTAPATPQVTSTDPEIVKAAGMLAGTFACAAEGERPAMVLCSAVIGVEGLDNAVYFEIARQDSVTSPYRQGVFHLYRRQGELRLRVLNFDPAKPTPTFTAAVAGLWAAPEVFPKVTMDMLSVNLELSLAPTAAGFAGKSAAPMPTMASGATEIVGAIELGTGRIALADRGYDASGKQVWGPAAGASMVFAAGKAPATAQKRGDGMVMIEYVAPTAGAAAAVDGMETAIHLTGWIANTGQLLGTTRTGNNTPYRVALPGTDVLSAGFQAGLAGMTVGTVRKLVIPAAMAAKSPGRFPPNTPVSYLIECMYVGAASGAAAPAAPAGGEANPNK